MSRDSNVRLDDIAAAAARIQCYVAGRSSAEFAADGRTQDAVIRNLEVIGEAVKKLPDDIRQRAPAVEWRKIAGLRDILIHAYFNVDVDLVWEIATVHVKALQPAIEQLRQSQLNATTDSSAPP